MKKVLSLLLVLTMLFTAGCSAVAGPGETTAPKEENPLVGKWVAEMDFTDFFNEYMKKEMASNESMEDFMDDIEIDSFAVEMTFTFDDDGEAELSFDEDAFEDEMRNACQDIIDDLLEILVKELKKAIKDQGMSETDFEDYYNMTIKEYAEQALVAEVGDLDDFIDDKVKDMEFPDFLTTDGEYRLDGNKLYLGDNDGYFVIDLDDDTFSLSKYKGDIPEELEELFECLLDAEFERD